MQMALALSLTNVGKNTVESVTAVMALDFSAQSPGTLLTTAKAAASKIGGTGYTFEYALGGSHVGAELNQVTLETDGSAPTYSTPFNIGGTLFDGEGDLVVTCDRFGRVGNDNKYEGLSIVPSGGSVTADSTITYFFKTTATAGAEESLLDESIFNNGANYTVGQNRVSTGGALTVLSHSDGDGNPVYGPSFSISSNTWYRLDHRHNITDGYGEILVRNAATGAIVGASRNPTAAPAWNNFQPGKGYLNSYGGIYRWKSLVESRGTYPPGGVTMTNPSSVIAQQTDVNQVTITWSAPAFTHKVERDKNSTGYTTLTNSLTTTSYVDSDVTTGDTVLYRVTAQIATHSSSAIATSSITLAAGAWQDLNSSGATDTDGVVPRDDLHWTEIPLTTGSAIKLRGYVRAFSFATTLKMGIYSLAGAKLQEGTVAVSATGYAQITISTQGITTGNYILAWICPDNAAISLGYQNAVGTLSYKVGVTVNTLPATLPAADGTVTRKYAVGVFVL